MSNLKNELVKRQNLYNKMNQVIDLSKSKSQDGNIRISTCNGRGYYYLQNNEICKEHKGGKYLKSGDLHIAKDILQNKYYGMLQAQINKKLAIINEVIESEPLSDLIDIYENMHPLKKALIIPLVCSDQEYIEKWQSEEYEGKPFEPGTIQLFSRRGERVRSKSERIIADTLYDLKIPYKYEKPLDLINQGGRKITVYPDFTILDIKNRRDIYFEHFGRMGDTDYVMKTLRKINCYESNGIFPGETLLMTFETSDQIIDTTILDKLLEKYFLS